jgi:ABC-type transport system involved in multi-copper enzyme maturation permease subunit
MLRYIFLKELQIALLNRRLVVSCLALVVLMVIGGTIFEKRYRSMLREYEEFLLQEGQGIEKLTADKQQNVDLFKQSGQVAPQEMIDEYMKIRLNELIFVNRSVSKEPSKLSFIASHNSSLPNGLEMDYFRMSIPKIYSAYNLYFRSFVALDWVNIILYFLSFICLCFAYDAFSGERQQGTLKLMLASSVPRSQILTGKLFALWCILLVPVVAGIVVHLLVMQFSVSVALSAADYYKILIFFLVTVLFTGVNILLYFAISILTPRASVSSIVCLLCWIILVFVLPNTGWVVSGKLHRVPSMAEQNLREETLINDADDKTIRYSSFWYQDWENRAADIYKWKNKNDQLENIRRTLWDEYLNSLYRQTDASIALSKISPFIVFRFMGDRIADNNYYGYRNFHRQVMAYHDAYRSFIIDKDAADPQSRHLIWNDHWQGCLNYVSQAAIDPSEVPVFKQQPPDIAALLYESRADIAILLLWTGILCGLVYVAFVRYDVR